MTLHILSQAPSHSANHSCFKHAQAGETVILINDGAYSLHQDLRTDITIVALEDDTKARGIREDHAAKLISYSEFVELTTQHSPIQSWY